jgi:hypothetical protein
MTERARDPDVTIPCGIYAGRALRDTPTAWCLWAASTSSFRRSHPRFIPALLRELGRRLQDHEAVMREFAAPGPRHPPRNQRSVQELLNPTPKQRLAAAKRKLARVTKRAESVQAAALLNDPYAAALLDEYLRRGLDLVE